VRYGSIGALEYEVPQSRLYCQSVYQRGSLLDGLAMYLSCDTKKFHGNESTRTLHNIWTSTHRGGSFPPFPPGGATARTPICATHFSGLTVPARYSHCKVHYSTGALQPKSVIAKVSVWL